MSVIEIIDKPSYLINTKYIPPYNQVLGYGQFSYNASITVLGANTSTAIPYDTTEISSFCAYSGSTIDILKAGVWKFAYSVQLDKTGGGTSHCDIWIRKNGVNIPSSTSRCVVASQNGETFVYCEYILSLNLNDKIQVMFSSPDSTMTATYFIGTGTPPNDIPAVPSIITTLVQLN